MLLKINMIMIFVTVLLSHQGLPMLSKKDIKKIKSDNKIAYQRGEFYFESSVLQQFKY